MPTLVDLFRRRHGKSAFEALLAPHMDRLYRLAYRFTGNRSDAEDLVQDLLLRLYPRRASLARVEQPGAWLARALYNGFIDRIRQQGRDPLHLREDEYPLDEQTDQTPQPERLVDAGQVQARLQTAMQDLNPDQRALVALHDIEGYSLNELEHMLATPLGTLKSRLHRARRHLRQALVGEPFDDSWRVKR